MTYVVITPDGLLRTCTVEDCIDVDAWGSPYQRTLWAAVHRDVDPYFPAVNGVPLPGDMRVKLADLAEEKPELYPANPVASAVLTVLGLRPRTWAGVIVIVGSENDEGLTSSLTVAQLETINDAYRRARLDDRGRL